MRPTGGRAGVEWFAVWRCRLACPLAGCGPLRPTGSLAQRAGLLGMRRLSGCWTRLLPGTVVSISPCAYDTEAKSSVYGWLVNHKLIPEVVERE